MWIFCSIFGLPMAIKILLSKITILMWHELCAKSSFVPIGWAARKHCSSEKSEDQEGSFAVLKMSHMKETRTVIIYVIWWKFNVEINILLFTVPINHPVSGLPIRPNIQCKTYIWLKFPMQNSTFSSKCRIYTGQ